jgi:hypothetical protein
VDRDLVFFAVLLVCLCASAVVVWYFAKHNPNPRFRPRPGEVLLVSIIAMGLSGGSALLMSGILGAGASFQDGDLDIKKVRAGSGGSSSGADEDANQGQTEEKPDMESLPPWLRNPEE